MTRIDLDANEPKRVTVAISLDPGTPVRADTQVDITYQGFTGAAAVALKGGSAQAPRLTPKDGQPPLLVAGPEVGRTLTESAQETLRRVDAILERQRQAAAHGGHRRRRLRRHARAQFRARRRA